MHRGVIQDRPRHAEAWHKETMRKGSRYCELVPTVNRRSERNIAHAERNRLYGPKTPPLTGIVGGVVILSVLTCCRCPSVSPLSLLDRDEGQFADTGTIRRRQHAGDFAVRNVFVGVDVQVEVRIAIVHSL